VVIPLGSFQLGSPESEQDRKSNEGPRVSVRIERGFALARTEITVAEFRSFVRASGYTPSASQSGSSTIYDERSGSMSAKSGVSWESDHAGKNADDNLPVIHASWVDAKAYADWLSRETGKAYRLPSEAEFEYVLRSGTQTRYPWGDGNPGRLVGNLTGDADRSESRRNWVNAFPDYSDGYWGPAPVRNYEANRYGIHDINGNVSEWVEDCWHDSYQRAPSNGTAWVNAGCNRRVIRGGSWASSPDQARSAFRLTASPTTTNARLGFRVARDL
jgi:formylglycine-generating enzyme required for sulfatase activity